MIIRATADTHGQLPDIEPCDLLLIGGDVCPIHSHSLATQHAYLEGPFAEWLEEIEADEIIGIGGNHDYIFEKQPEVPRSLPWTYLCNESAEVGDLKVYGTPWVPNLPRWAFYGGDRSVSEEKIGDVPDDTDILLSHGPMYLYADVVGPMYGGPKSVGCWKMPDVVERVQPDYFVCGHIHEAFGHYRHRHVKNGIFSVSHNNEMYEPINPIVVLHE